MAMYINGGHMHMILWTQVDYDNVYNTGNKQCLLMYCGISLNRPTVAATGLHIMGYVLSSLCRNLHYLCQCFWSCRRTRYSTCAYYLAINWAIWSLKCGHASETANALSKYQLVKSNVLARKWDGRRNSHWFIACYAQNTPTGIQTNSF